MYIVVTNMQSNFRTGLRHKSAPFLPALGKYRPWAHLDLWWLHPSSDISNSPLVDDPSFAPDALAFWQLNPLPLFPRAYFILFGSDASSSISALNPVLKFSFDWSRNVSKYLPFPSLFIYFLPSAAVSKFYTHRVLKESERQKRDKSNLMLW